MMLNEVYYVRQLMTTESVEPEIQFYRIWTFSNLNKLNQMEWL